MNRWTCVGLLAGVLLGVGCRSNPPPTSTLPPAATIIPTAAVLQVELPSPTPASLPETATPTSPPLPTATATPLPAYQAVYAGAALDLLAQLNQWRVSQGLWPFAPNAMLDEMALAQARYVGSRPSLPENYHEDERGRGMFQRAADLGWPHYSNPQQIAVGEVAYVGANISAAINFWQNSQIHNQTITNEGYREIGIGIVPHTYGSVYMVVVGSRPDVLTALVDPVSGQVYVSSERYRWSDGGDWLHDATRMQLVDSASAALNDAAWTPFQLSINARHTATFYVALADDQQAVIVEVNPYTNIAWLPSNLASVGQSPTPMPTALPNASIALIYDANSLSVQNISGGGLDYTGIVLGEGAPALPLTHWLSYFKNDPNVMSAFPAGECLQVYAMGIAYPGAHAACSIVRGVISVKPENVFWKQPFAVYRSGQAVGACAGGDGRCEIHLP